MERNKARPVHISEPLIDQILDIAKKLKRDNTADLLRDRLKLYLYVCEFLNESKNYEKLKEIYEKNILPTLSNLKKLNAKISQKTQKRIEKLAKQLSNS